MPHRATDIPSFATIGERIVFWRERRGLTRPQLAKLAKIPYSTLAEIENNRQKGSTKLPQIAAALRVNANYLLTDKGNPEDITGTHDGAGSSGAWPFSFDPEEISDLDPIELELAEMKLQRIIEEIRAKRPRLRTRKAG